jgi:dipeptidyl aminopeptidase/acylaminoacyl peptidase
MKNKIYIVGGIFAVIMAIAGTAVFAQLSEGELSRVPDNRFDPIYALPAQGAMNKVAVIAGLSGAGGETSVIYLDMLANFERRLYLSPDRKSAAITVRDINNDFGSTSTYISGVDGGQLTNVYHGTFVAWSPDSQKALLYLSGFENEGGRRIYYLGIDDTYYDSGLPERVIGADVSPKDGSIVYSLTEPGTDRSNLYIRDQNGNDRLLVEGNGNILAWVRWSPDGDKIVFMQSDRWISSGQQSVWVINPDATGAEKISDIAWSYPPVWSPDGSKIAFANAGNIWEYNVAKKALGKLTNFDKGTAMQPSYSQDGGMVTFISDFSGQQQVWVVRDGRADQLTNDNQDKGYPILP